jgi:hypothetical protein
MSTLQIVAEMAKQYQQQYDEGNISADEFKELLADLQTQEHIYQTASELAQDEEYRAILIGVLQVAGSL